MRNDEGTTIGAVTEHASQSAATLLSRLPRSASATTDAELLEAVSVVAELGRAQQTAMSVLADEISVRSQTGDGAESLAVRNGQKDAVGLLQVVGRLSRASARRACELGAAIVDREALTGARLPPRWEHVAEAAFAGVVDAEAAAPVVGALEDVRRTAEPELLEAAEEGMMRITEQSTPERTRRELRVWRDALDQDGARPREEAQRRARYLRIGRENPDGMTPLRGLLTPDAAARLRAAVSTQTNPRARVSFLPGAHIGTGPDGGSGPEGGTGRIDGTVPDGGTDSGGGSGFDGGAGPDTGTEVRSGPGERGEAGVGSRTLDPRTRDQKLHDVLDGLIRAGHRASVTGPAGSRRTATDVIVTVTLDDLRAGRGVGWINGMDEPTGPVTTERIICDEGFRALVLGEQGEALWLGTKQRVFTAQQKLAIAARDETCGWVDCDAPADLCEVHHVTFHRDGGPTDVDNGILLCSAHHHMLHAQGWRIEMRRGVPYLHPPAFLNRTGEPIRLGRHRGHEAVRRRRRTPERMRRPREQRRSARTVSGSRERRRPG